MRGRSTSLMTVLAVAIAGPSAAMQLELSRPELCGLAERVVIGEVTSGETLWAEGDTGGILRRVWLASERQLRGSGPDTVEIVLPGGTIGDVTHTVEDVPELDVDGRYLLFLSRNEAGSWQVIGGEQGAVRIQPPQGGDGERFVDALVSVGRCDAP